MVFKEVQEENIEIWQYTKEGDNVTGYYIKKQEDVGPNKSLLYTFEHEGKPFRVWGSAILDSRMEWVKIGSLVRVTYKGLGEKKQGKHAPKIFKVEVDDDQEKVSPKEVSSEVV